MTARTDSALGAPALAARSINSPIGTLTAVASQKGLRELLWLGVSFEPDPGAENPSAEAETMAEEAAAQLASWFEGRRTSFDVPFDIVGPEFSAAVWRALAEIPYAETISYGELARRVGRPKAARAVGGAVGRNPLPIVLPCHRVIGSSGALTGFGGGLDTKRWLLAHEAAVASGT